MKEKRTIDYQPNQRDFRLFLNNATNLLEGRAFQSEGFT